MKLGTPDMQNTTNRFMEGKNKSAHLLDLSAVLK